MSSSRLRLAVLRPFDHALRGIGRAARNARDRAVIGDDRAGRLAQHAIEFRPADAPARIVGDLRQRKVEQHRAVGERNAPVSPWEARGVDLRRPAPDRAHCNACTALGPILSPVPESEWSSRATRVRGRSPRRPASRAQAPRHDAAGNAGADDHDAHQRLRSRRGVRRSQRSGRRRPGPDARRRRTRKSAPSPITPATRPPTAPRIWRWALMSVSSSMVWRWPRMCAAPVGLAFDEHRLHAAAILRRDLRAGSDAEIGQHLHHARRYRAHRSSAGARCARSPDQ